MTLKPLLLLPLALAVGCLAAPREVETTIDLGPQKVEIDVRLRDIRTEASDDLTQLRVFNEFARWNPEWINELPWAPTPTRFEYLRDADAGRLDLAMHGSMSRADFDKCARAAFDAGVCEDFPLALGKSGYSVRPEILSNQGLRVDPKARASWPADAGRIGYRVGLSGRDDPFINVGPSLQRGFALHQSSPASAAETLKKIEASEALFVSGSVADWLTEVAALEACTEQPWCRLRQEAVRRDQLRLVYSYLRLRPEGADGLRAPPSRHIDFLGTAFTALLPKDLLPPIDELRLRVRYDVQRDAFGEQGWVTAEPKAWAPVCRPDTMKKPSLKDFCARLGVRPARR